MKFNFILKSLLFISILPLQAMDEPNKYYSIILPGQNGCGGQTYEDYKIINTPFFNHYETLKNCSKIDLGQQNCVAHFDQQLQDDVIAKKKKLLLYGISQGTSTLLNWLSQKPKEEQNKLVGCIFLESVLGNGNSAILRTLQTQVTPLAYIPFARYFLPIASKLFFPSYKPFGMQAINSSAQISSDIPVIIMHNKNDFQLSINDARKVYCSLRENNNNNAYLIELDNGDKHLNILSGSSNKDLILAAIQTIFKKYKLPNSCTTEIALDEFQPSIAHVRQRIKHDSQRTNIIHNTIDLFSAALVASYINSLMSE